jgi:hypothetical protein
MKLLERLRRPRVRTSALASDAPRNEYYENISTKLGILQVVLYLSLFAFVCLAFFANTNLITYQNFYHFFQDLGASAEKVDLFSADSVSYPTDEVQSFTLYRKGLAVAGNTNVTVFSATGRPLISHQINYQNPVAVGAGKYLLVYEKGGKQYSLYNANTQMYAGESEMPINGAAISDSGAYALISSSKTSTSSVYLYNSRFAPVNAYHRSGYVMGAALSADGKRIALLTLSANAGVEQTTVTLAEVGKTVPLAETVLDGSMGVDCAFTSSGMLAVLCGNGIAYLDEKGAQKEFYDFEGKIPTMSSVGTDGIAVCLKKNTISPKNIVIVFDKNGKMVYNETVGERLCDLAYAGRAVFWTTDRGIYRLELADQGVAFTECATDGRRLLAASEGEALLCSPQKAFYISFHS